ncbi:MAG: hypothetical protein LJE67_15405 [Salaquimonas sp.]|nr:hypothetical protein [Salaquimonas sp.]
MAAEQSTPLLYAICPSGQSLKYVLADPDQVRTAEIIQLLLDRGVDIEDLEYTAFSRNRNPFGSIEFEDLSPPTLIPDVPSIPLQKNPRPENSPIQVNASRLLSDFIKDKSFSFFMKWRNHGFIDVINNYVVPQMEHPDIDDLWFPGGTRNPDYLDIVEGRVRISYGLQWVYEDSFGLKPGSDSGDMLLARKYGLSSHQQKTLSASIGCSLSTLSHGLSNIFKKEIIVHGEHIDQFRYNLKKNSGSGNFHFWSLAQTFGVERLVDNDQWRAIEGYTIPVFSKAIAIDLVDGMSGITMPFGSLPQMVAS